MSPPNTLSLQNTTLTCVGQTGYTITNGGFNTIANFTGSLNVSLHGAKISQPNSYNYASSNVGGCPDTDKCSSEVLS